MQPVFNKWFFSCSFRLGNLIFVVGENKVITAAVNIERLA